MLQDPTCGLWSNSEEYIYIPKYKQKGVERPSCAESISKRNCKLWSWWNGSESGAALRSETCKEEWVSPTDSVRANETITYGDKL